MVIVAYSLSLLLEHCSLAFVSQQLGSLFCSVSQVLESFCPAKYHFLDKVLCLFRKCNSD
jgi:hypothetical protein